MEPRTREQEWEKLKTWLDESIAAVERADLTRLPADFNGERQGCHGAYETVRQAIHIHKQWDTLDLPKSKTLS